MRGYLLCFRTFSLQIMVSDLVIRTRQPDEIMMVGDQHLGTYTHD